MMNKLSFILTAMFLMITAGAYSQTESTTGTAEANFAIYKKKVSRSEEQLTNEKKTSNPKWWLGRAELMRDIFNLNRDFLQQGREKIHVSIFYPNPKETKTWKDEEGNEFEELIFDFVTITMKNGRVDKFEETILLYEDPLKEALRCLEKAQELDVDGKLDKKVKEQYDALKIDFERLAIEEFFKPDYKKSFYAFSRLDVINQKEIMEGAVDDTMLYYAGMAASKAEMIDECIEYYEKAIAAGYGDPDIYVFLKQKYFSVGDTAKGVEILEKGFERYPEHQSVIIELINYYLIAGRQDAALEYLRIAQADDPENLSFIFAEATLYDKMGEREKAMTTYQKCIDIDPEYFNAYYNMGVMYYNEAVEMLQYADENIKTPKEYGEAVDEALEVLKEALPFMEKANSLQPEDRSTLETLKTLYYRLQMTDKYNEVKDILDAMPEEKKAGEM